MRKLRVLLGEFSIVLSHDKFSRGKTGCKGKTPFPEVKVPLIITANLSDLYHSGLQ